MNVKVIKHTTDSEPSGLLTVNAYMQDTTSKKYMHNLHFAFGNNEAGASIVSDISEAITTYDEFLELLTGYTSDNPCTLIGVRNTYDSSSKILTMNTYTSIHRSTGTNVVIKGTQTTITLSSTGTVSDITAFPTATTVSSISQIKDFVQEI